MAKKLLLVLSILVLFLAVPASPPPARGLTIAGNIEVDIFIVRGQQESGYFDSFDVRLTPGLERIEESAVILNRTEPLRRRIESGFIRHTGLFRTGIQTLDIFIRRAGEPSFGLRFDPYRSGIKPMATAVINVKDNLTWISPPTFSSTRLLGDVVLEWREDGPPATFLVKAQEEGGSGREVFRRERFAGTRMTIPAAVIEAGKRYCFQVVGSGRVIGTLSGSYGPRSQIAINTYIQCFIYFKPVVAKS